MVDPSAPNVERAQGAYRYDVSRPIIHVVDPRLNRLFLREPLRCASVTEYSRLSGVDVADVVELLGCYLDDGTLALEPYGGEIFVLTAPRGRPIPRERPDVAPNFWEVLRRNQPPDGAFRTWQLARGLETAGWSVEVSPARIMFGLAQLMSPPFLGIEVGHTVVPVVDHPDSNLLAAPAGMLAEYDRSGAAALAVVCDEGGLDSVVTAVRRYVVARRLVPRLSVLVLESPRYHPTLLTPTDTAIEPRAVSRQTLINEGIGR